MNYRQLNEEERSVLFALRTMGQRRARGAVRLVRWVVEQPPERYRIHVRWMIAPAL